MSSRVEEVGWSGSESSGALDLPAFFLGPRDSCALARAPNDIVCIVEWMSLSLASSCSESSSSSAVSSRSLPSLDCRILACSHVHRRRTYRAVYIIRAFAGWFVFTAGRPCII